MASDKDTIYIDVDDEITGIIDKVQGSNGKVVALVLPKRAAVFQSIVNMKLLKRAADSSGKNLALITTEAGLLPLAGVAGIHVAKTLNSKPEIPTAPKLNEDAEESVDEDGEITPDTAGDQPVGDLAGKPPADTGMETLTLDDDTLPPETPEAPKSKSFDPPAKGKGAGKGKNKKFKIPDFDRFRLLLVGGILLLIALIVFIILAVKVLPKATITIDTDAQSIDSNLSLNLSTTAKQLEPDSGTIPAQVATQQKTYSQQVATTGQKNNGNRASGTVSLTNCSNQDGTITIPAGTGLVSGGNTFITQSSVTVDEAEFNNSHTKCTSKPSASVNVLAQSAGAAYNGATGFTAGNPYSGISGTGSTSGGTDNIVHSVNQNDITSAKAKINTSDPAIKSTLEGQLKKSGYFVIDATFSSGTPVTTQSAQVGAVADNVTVTETVTYTVFGVHKSDLKTLVDDDVSSQIDTNKQKIQDEGIDKANFNVENQSPTGAQVTMSTKAIAGPDIDVATIQKNAAGQKAGKIKGDLDNNPGIKSVDVNLSPFWVSNAPKNTDKIHVIIAAPKSTASHN